MSSSKTNDSIDSSLKNNNSLPKSNSTTFTKTQFHLQLSKNNQSSNLNLADFLNPLLGYSELSISPLTSTSSYSSLSSFAFNPNLDAYFTYTIGSSFYNGSANYAIVLSISEIKELCQIIKKIFVKNVISQINRYLNEFLTIQKVLCSFIFLHFIYFKIFNNLN